jgi:hypothetical protein
MSPRAWPAPSYSKLSVLLKFRGRDFVFLVWYFTPVIFCWVSKRVFVRSTHVNIFRFLMNVKTLTYPYGFLSIHTVEPHSSSQLSFSALNVRHSLFLLTTTQYGYYIVKVSERCDLSTCSRNCVFAVTRKVLFSFIPQKTSTSFSVHNTKLAETQQVAGVSSDTLASVGGRNTLGAFATK